MDSRFESLVLRALAEDEDIQEMERHMAAIRSRYSNGEVLGVDAEVFAIVQEQHASACTYVRRQEEAFWAEVRPNRPFLHARYITTERLPERCVITKLVYCSHGELFQVYYRTADGEGMRTKCDPWFFRSKSFGEWA